MSRSYYSDKLSGFLQTNQNEILIKLCDNDIFEPSTKQNNAWREQIKILQEQLQQIKSGYIMFEYTIPRMGKRVDAILLYSDFIFVMEFKVNKTSHQKQDENQCIDYALDLKNFHKKSHCASIVPILVSTDAKAEKDNQVIKSKDGVYDITRANKSDIIKIIKDICDKKPDCTITASEWENSEYMPTPTITEAAMALCSKITGLEDITRSDAGAENLGVTTKILNKIIEKSKSSGSKSICFVTGVPGSGKTLAALNLICDKQGASDESAILLSGNKTLVEVLKTSLEKGGECMKGYRGSASAALIQHIPEFRRSLSNVAPVEKIIVFDEAQRAWSAKKLAKINMNKNQNDQGMSDPELIINAMDKHDGWAVIVCLMGAGQEIYDGEVGLSGWLDAIREKHPDWHVYHSEQIKDSIYYKEDISKMLKGIKSDTYPSLHLNTSIRSFRGNNLAKLVREILDCNITKAQATWKEIRDQYPIVLTRDITVAKRWVREKARGTERYGMVASSGADRLRPYGIYVRAKIKPKEWFLANKEDMRSSYYLEDVATEFYIQGLELDWVCLAWDANLRYEDGAWSHHIFFGNNWRSIKQEKKRSYLENSYRVLMTRARQGMVIFIPKGDEEDKTRNAEFYDGVYDYLKKIGFPEIES